jgi:hypothetical protein
LGVPLPPPDFLLASSTRRPFSLDRSLSRPRSASSVAAGRKPSARGGRRSESVDKLGVRIAKFEVMDRLGFRGGAPGRAEVYARGTPKVKRIGASSGVLYSTDGERARFDAP